MTRRARRLRAQDRRSLVMDRRGAAAVEFAILAPVMLMVLCGILAYGMLFATHISLQQLVAETARATVGGLSAAEREGIARAHVERVIGRYPLLRAEALELEIASQAGFTEVRLIYDAGVNPAYVLDGLLPLPERTARYSQVIRDGGA